MRTGTASRRTLATTLKLDQEGKTVRSGRARRFEIIFRPDTDEAPIPLESAVDANQATMVFHTQFQRLKREGTPGELVILNSHDRHDCSEGNTVLRQPLR